MVNKEQAVKAVKNYARIGNKEQACLQAGYSKTTARKQQTAIIERGTQELAKRGTKEAKSILAEIGRSRQDLIDVYNEIAFEQSRDYSNKLKALSPLLKAELNLDINGGDEQTKTPVLNITLNNPTLEREADAKEIE